MSGSRFQCSNPNILPVRPRPVWISSQMSRVPCLRQSSCARWKKIGLRRIAALALHRLDDKSRHIALRQLAFQRREIIERDPRLESFHERPETFGETFAAHQRKRAEAQVRETRSRSEITRFRCGGGAGKFQRAFDRFGAGVAEEDRVEMRRGSLRHRLGQQAAQKRAIHLDHVRQIEIEHVADRLFHRRMVPPDIENAVAAQEIKIRRRYPCRRGRRPPPGHRPCRTR